MSSTVELTEAVRRMVVTDEHGAVTTQHKRADHEAVRAHLAATTGHLPTMIQSTNRFPDAKGPGDAWIVHNEAGKAMHCWVETHDD